MGIVIARLVLGSLFLFAPRFLRHDIDAFPSGYQVAVADVNADGKPDVIALSTDADRVDWYENPAWKRYPVSRTAKNIDLAPRDLDGDRRPEIALASGFYFSESSRGGEIQWLKMESDRSQPWSIHRIAVDPVTHRIRWGDLDGDGKVELIHAPLFGAGSDGARSPKPAHLWAFGIPAKPGTDAWDVWKMDETMTVLHGLNVSDLDGDGRDEILTASFEGIHRFDFEGDRSNGSWRRTTIGLGSKPVEKGGVPSRGSSEVAPGKVDAGHPFIAAIEPWHGHEVVVYRPPVAGRSTGLVRTGRWDRQVLDDRLDEGHALAVADLDADGADEIVAGWRAGGGGLVLYDAADPAGERFEKAELDRGIAVEGAVAADLNGDGRIDLVVIAGRTNNLAWYENAGR